MDLRSPRIRATEVSVSTRNQDRPGWQLKLPKPRNRSLGDFKVAIWPNDELAPVEQEVADRAVRIGESLAKLGATVSDRARPDFETKRAHVTYSNLLNSIMTAGVPEEVYDAMKVAAGQTDPKDFSDESVMARSAVLSHRDWLRSNNHRERLRYAWRDFFDEWDILICPRRPRPPSRTITALWRPAG